MLKLVTSSHMVAASAPQPPQSQAKAAEYTIGIHSYDVTQAIPHFSSYHPFPSERQTYVVPRSEFTGQHTFALHLHRRKCQLSWVQVYGYYPDDKYGDPPLSMDIPSEWQGCHVTLIKLENGIVLFITEHEIPTGTLLLGYQHANPDLRFISLRYLPPYAEREAEPTPTNKGKRKSKKK